MERQVTVIIDMDKETMQRAPTAVIEHLALYPPSAEDHNTELCLGLQVLFDCLRSTFE